MNELIRAALAYQALGFSVVPVRADKSSMGGWREYQQRIISVTEIQRRFGWRSTDGIAIVCGRISSNLEIIDVDTKNDLSGRLYADFIQAVNQHAPGLMGKTVIARTRSHGYHVMYKTSTLNRYMMLARRPTTEAERRVDPDTQALVLMESMAENRYVLVEPSPGYRFIQGSLGSVVTLGVDEREILISAARSLNTYLPYKRQPKTRKTRSPQSMVREGSPMDDYDVRGDVVELLLKHHWEIISENEVRVCMRRPGKRTFKSSGDYHRILNRFTVFSTKTVFEREKGYRPSAVYTMLECGGDFKQAAQRLLREGYGIPRHMMIQ
jgi:hypothetical protein